MRHLRFTASPKSISIALENGIFTQANTIQWAYPLAHLESKTDACKTLYSNLCASRKGTPHKRTMCSPPLKSDCKYTTRTKCTQGRSETVPLYNAMCGRINADLGGVEPPQKCASCQRHQRLRPTHKGTGPVEAK